MSYRNVLLIDDDEDDQHIFMTAAAEVSGKVNCVGLYDARDALQKLTSREVVPDVIFLDLNMPMMTGEQFLSEIKRHKDLENIPIIVISTTSNQTTIKTVRDMGAAAFITKPSLFDDLVDVLKRILAPQ